MIREIQLGDIAELNQETYKKSNFPNIIKYLDTGNLTKNKIDSIQLINSKNQKVPSRAQRKVKKNTILYSTVRPNQLHYGIVENIIPDLVVSTGFTTIDIIDKNIWPKYFYYLLTQTYVTDYLHSLAQNSVSSYPSISPNDLMKLKFKVPDLIKQKRIGKILSDLDTKIELNNKINAELEAMAKLMYDYWFVQFDFPNEYGKPYKSSGGKMVYNKELKREIPEGWEVKHITKEMNLQYGFPFSTKLFNEEEKGVPVIRIRDILDCTISNYSTEEVDDKYKLEKGDVLVGMDGNFHINYWNKDNCYLNQRCLRIRSKETSISEVQARYAIEPYIKAREKNVSRTTVAHLSARDINDLKVLKATEEVQSKANGFFKSNLHKIISNREQNQKLAELRDWLLPMLMNGQVTVGEVEKELGIVAEPGETYLKDKESIDALFEIVNYDYEVAAIQLLTESRFGFTYGKKYTHKMFSNIEMLSTMPKLKDLAFEEMGWGMFSKAIAKTIDAQKFIYFNQLDHGAKVLKVKPNATKEITDWMARSENKDFVSHVNRMLNLYEKPLINKDMDRIELLNTVLECMKVLKTDNLQSIRAKMAEWRMYENNNQTKAEKFTQNETLHMIQFIKNDINRI